MEIKLFMLKINKVKSSDLIEIAGKNTKYGTLYTVVYPLTTFCPTTLTSIVWNTIHESFMSKKKTKYLEFNTSGQLSQVTTHSGYLQDIQLLILFWKSLQTIWGGSACHSKFTAINLLANIHCSFSVKCYISALEWRKNRITNVLRILATGLVQTEVIVTVSNLLFILRDKQNKNGATINHVIINTGKLSKRKKIKFRL